MYELPGEPHCDTCGGCGDVALDGSRLEVLSHGEAHHVHGRRFKAEDCEKPSPRLTTELKTMNMASISQLVGMHDFEMLCWNDYDSRGAWAACLPGLGQAEGVRDAFEDDLVKSPATKYVLKPNWLPVVSGATLEDAVTRLEDRLATLDSAQLTRDSDWGIAVFEALAHLMDVKRASKVFGDPARMLRPLPEDYGSVAQAIYRYRRDRGDIAW